MNDIICLLFINNNQYNYMKTNAGCVEGLFSIKPKNNKLSKDEINNNKIDSNEESEILKDNKENMQSGKKVNLYIIKNKTETINNPL